MKTHLVTILLVISWTISQAQKIDISVCRDTFNVGVSGRLLKVELFHDNFFCMFSTPRKNTIITFKKMVALSKNGQFVEDVFLPEDIVNMMDFYLIVDNDSLFIKHNLNNFTYALDPYIANFKLVAEREFNLYKDTNYDVSSDCFGEWGGTVYFVNRHSGLKYEGSAGCPFVINKIENEYYVTNYIQHMIGHSSVIKIENPEKLAKANSRRLFRGGSESTQGIEKLIDTFGLKISTSLIIDNKLVHLYSDDQGSYLGVIENMKLNQIHKFNFIFKASIDQQLSDGRQVLTCYFEESKRYGILIIDGNRFNFHEFH